ncbi:MAG TPA: S1C family serine protease [Steroidobacteraceae bacterium]
MTESSLLQQWSRERSELASRVAPRTLAIALGRHRSLSAMRWRGDLVVTAAEALAGSERAVAIGEGFEAPAAVLACDLATDVAVLRVSAESPPTPADAGISVPDDASELVAAAGVIVVGRTPSAPLVGFGTVRLSGPAWQSRRGGAIARRLEFDAQLDARFEGALVADLAGVARAMLVSGPRGKLLGIPMPTIERIVAAVERHGYLPRPYLGLRLQWLWLDRGTRERWGRSNPGIIAVAGVEPQSPAESVGLAPGDLLEALDGVEVADVGTFAARIGQSRPGQRLELSWRRGGQIQTAPVDLAEWRSARA